MLHCLSNYAWGFANRAELAWFMLEAQIILKKIAIRNMVLECPAYKACLCNCVPDVLGNSEKVLPLCSAAAAAAHDSVFLSDACCADGFNANF